MDVDTEKVSGSACFFFESKVKRLDDDGEFALLLSKPQTWRREKDWKDVKGTCSDGLSSWIVEIQNEM